MSDALTSPAQAVEAQAAQWLLRRDEPGWSADDQRALEAWLEESTSHKAAFWRLEHGWRAVGRLGALSPVALDAVAPEIDTPARPPSRRPAAGTGRAGPCAAGAAGRSPPAWSRQRPSSSPWACRWPAATATPPRSAATRPCPWPTARGSSSAPTARLVADVRHASRNVWLDHGEAYFEVAHDPRHPFVVHAGPRTITVLGTRFAVRRDGDRVRVVVAEGRVKVQLSKAAIGASPATAPSAEVITRGDTLMAAAGSNLVSRGSISRVAGELSWREGRLTFDQETLGDAAAEFNRFNTTRLVVADAAVADMRIGGSFEAGNVEGFARLMQEAYGLRVARHDGEIEISR